LLNLRASKLALRAIRFKFHDRVKQCPIGFQSTTPETTQNDEYFCTYRHSVALGSITGVTRSMKGVDTRMHTRPMCQHINQSKGLLIDAPYNFYYFQPAHYRIQKARGSRSTLHTTSSTFHTCLPSCIKSKGLHRYVLHI
jgi:hypothetical protein